MIILNSLGISLCNKSKKTTKFFFMFKVFFLVGGSANFICKSVKGIFSFENGQKEVADLERMGYKAMAVKNGHIVGGYCSFNEFETAEKAREYYGSL